MLIKFKIEFLSIYFKIRHKTFRLGQLGSSKWTEDWSGEQDRGGGGSDKIRIAISIA